MHHEARWGIDTALPSDELPPLSETEEPVVNIEERALDELEDEGPSPEVAASTSVGCVYRGGASTEAAGSVEEEVGGGATLTPATVT